MKKISLSALAAVMVLCVTPSVAAELSRAEQAKWDRWCQKAYDNDQHDTMKFRNHCEVLTIKLAEEATEIIIASVEDDDV